MSVDDIIPGSPLARALDDYPVPGLSAGFADRVLAAAENRAAPLPELRRKSVGGGGGRGWRMGRRIMIGAACFGALATAAAATGVLERFDIAVPSPEKVWASLTGKETPVAAAPIISKPAEPASAAFAPVMIEGPIDTPEELSEAFRRIDEVREGRNAVRRQVIDQRIDRAIERRRAAGLPVPTADEEAALRQRIDEAQALRQQRADERIKARREELSRKVENGEALNSNDIAGPRQLDPTTAARRERSRQLRQMTPQERREVFQALPPEQRRALAEEFRARRGATEAPAPQPAPQPVPGPAPEPTPDEPPAQPQS
jgi:hypothetical protein